ncbi:hypothetical protein DVH05_007817 [Phytophthora capsici]|nr:hypothetical protein DVH05_007817 [Phytophthora capsici]
MVMTAQELEPQMTPPAAQRKVLKRTQALLRVKATLTVTTEKNHPAHTILMLAAVLMKTLLPVLHRNDTGQDTGRRILRLPVRPGSMMNVMTVTVHF